MMFLLVLAIAAGICKRHMQESAMAYRLSVKPPLSVWTRLAIGHFLSSFGLVFGVSRLYLSLRERSGRVTFGAWLWSVVGLYVPLFVVGSVFWAVVNNLVRSVSRVKPFSSVPVLETIGRVSLMTFNQACFDQLAWLLAAVWISTAILRNAERFSIEEGSETVAARPDLSIAVFTGLVICGTVFQRFLESSGH